MFVCLWPIVAAPSDKSLCSTGLTSLSYNQSTCAGQQTFQWKVAQSYISNGRYRDRLGRDLLREYATLVAFIFLLLPAPERFEECVPLCAAFVITSICPAVLGGLSAFHPARDRSLTWPTVPTTHLFIGSRQHCDDCVRKTGPQQDARGGGGGDAGLSCQACMFCLARGFLHSDHLAVTHTDRSTKI